MAEEEKENKKNVCKDCGGKLIQITEGAGWGRTTVTKCTNSECITNRIKFGSAGGGAWGN